MSNCSCLSRLNCGQYLAATSWGCRPRRYQQANRLPTPRPSRHRRRFVTGWREGAGAGIRERRLGNAEIGAVARVIPGATDDVGASNAFRVRPR